MRRSSDADKETMRKVLREAGFLDRRCCALNIVGNSDNLEFPLARVEEFESSRWDAIRRLPYASDIDQVSAVPLKGPDGTVLAHDDRPMGVADEFDLQSSSRLPRLSLVLCNRDTFTKSWSCRSELVRSLNPANERN